MRLLIILSVTILLLTAFVPIVSADSHEDKGFFSKIIGFFKSIFSGLFGGSGDAEPPTTTQLCSPPYIQVGTDCCLDTDNNNICDSDDDASGSEGGGDDSTPDTTQPPTTNAPATTMATSTTTIATTTTTIKEIACTTNSDCGDRTEERVCYKGDVYIEITSPMCSKPGKTDAECKISKKLQGQSMISQPQPVEKCGSGCDKEKGECL